MATTEKDMSTDTKDDGDGDEVERRRGILKNRTDDKHHSGVQWDEMNILMTYHPADKDYGHMKINEPPTPYNKFKDPDAEGEEGPSVDPLSEDENDVLDPGKLSKKMVSVARRKSWEEPPPDNFDDDDDDDEEADMTEEEKIKHREFKKHRKEHYNEFSKVKLARKLIEEELKALEDENDENEENKDSSMEQ